MATSACRPISNAAGSYLCQVTGARSAGRCEPRGTAKSRRAGISSTWPCRARAEVRQSVARGERSRASTRSRSIRPSCGLRNRPWPTRSRLPAGERSRQRVQHCVQHRVQHRVRLRAWPRHGISLEFSGVLYPHALLWKDFYSKDRRPLLPPTESQRPRQAQLIRHEHRSMHRPPSHTFAGVRRSLLVLHKRFACARRPSSRHVSLDPRPVTWTRCRRARRSAPG